MEILLSEIFVDPKERLRQKTFGDIPGLAGSLVRFGQLNSIAVRTANSLTTDKHWEIVDGGRRFMAAQMCDLAGKTIPDVTPGHIECKVVEEDDDLIALEMEYHANEDREDFSWREKMNFVVRIHKGYLEREENWTQEDTAVMLTMTQATVSKFLLLASSPELLNDPAVRDAETFTVAYKQSKIVADRLKREKIVAFRKKNLGTDRPKGGKGGSNEGSLLEISDTGDAEVLPGSNGSVVREVSDNVFDLCINADLREWLPDQPSDHFDWFHWDPPYGAQQGGGAFGSHKAIDDSPENALGLVEFAIPEIARVLREGCWLAMWHHPDFKHEIQLYLQGHVRSLDGASCRYCEKRWPTFENPGTLANGCPAGEWAFWVNPYPFIWYKSNRMADGHEIQRFRTNQYEQFFVAGRIGEDGNPILPNSKGGNVLVHDTPSRAERRHVMHKPEALLADVLDIISIPGEFGADCSVGSGSIFEAALGTGRGVAGCELDKEYWLAATYAFERRRRSLAVSDGSGSVVPSNDDDTGSEALSTSSDSGNDVGVYIADDEEHTAVLRTSDSSEFHASEAEDGDSEPPEVFDNPEPDGG